MKEKGKENERTKEINMEEINGSMGKTKEAQSFESTNHSLVDLSL
jgi:hypothetical protein